MINPTFQIQSSQAVVVILADAQATRKLGRMLGEFLPAGSVVLLEGELGAGKTTLVQGIGEGLGIKDLIDSPTFTLINEYYQGRLPLYHLDLYRLQGGEIDAIAPEIYWEGVEVTPGITAIEWSQRLSYKPPHYLKIQLVDSVEQGRYANLTLTNALAFDLSILTRCVDSH